MKRIHLISGPRNISTALMYSFGNRADTSIVDEPLYAYYLKRHPEVKHPGQEEILSSQSEKLDEVLNEVFYAEYKTPNVFIKNMAHHLDDTDLSFLKDFTNVLLIREPKALIASFARVIPHPTILDIGLKLEWEIAQYLKENDIPLCVIDSGDLLLNPAKYLKSLCLKLGIEFSEEMLNWEAGSRNEDGIWAPYWYSNVHKSTGFTQKKLSDHPFPDHLNPLLEEANQYYNLLKENCIKL